MRLATLALSSLALTACGARSSLPEGEPASACHQTGPLTLSKDTFQSSHRVSNALVLSADRVFWMDPGDPVFGGGAIKSVPKCGGEVVTLAKDLEYPTDVAVDASDVYWTDAGDEGHGVPGGVLRAPRAGGPSVRLASSVTPLAIALDDAHVYFGSANAASVNRVPKDGGPVEMIVDQEAGQQDLAVDATDVYWTGVGDLRRAPKAGGGPTTTLGTMGVIAFLVTVDATDAYWAVSDGASQGSILKVPKTGGATTVLATASPTSLAVDDTDVYWTDGGGGAAGAGKILRVPKTGGAPTTLFTGLTSSLGGLALDAQSLYWIQDRDVVEAPK